MALAGSLTTNAYGGVRSLTLDWSATQDISRNTSTINWTLRGSGSTANYNPYYYSGPFQVVVDGAQVHYSTNRIQLRSGTVVASGSHTIWHNADGTRSFSIRIEGAIYSTSINCTAQQSFTLNQIPREAKLNSAPDFYDTDNPTIWYSNPAGLPIYAYIEVREPLSRPIAERKITGSSYTFNFTQAERDVLRAFNTTSNTQTMRFVLRTDMGGYSGYSWLDRTMTLRNPKPTISPTITDANSVTYGLTGDKNKFIKYYSTAKVTFGISTVGNVPVTSKKVTCGSKSRTSDGTITGVDSGSFQFTVTDSRGNTTAKTVNKTLIQYFNPTCNLGDNMPDGNGNFTFQVTGTCFNGSFGAVSNTLTVKYRYREVGGSYSAYKAMTVSRSGNNYTATVSLKLDSAKSYQFQAQAVDRLATATTWEKTVRSTPVFDWSRTDFNVNVPVTVQGIQLAKNSVLWSGAVWLFETQTIYLSSPVSSQQTGIVLVFSHYDGGPKDWDFSTWFVPKWVAQNIHNITTTYTHIYGGYIATKSIYVYDTFITGIASNSTGQYGPCPCGITTTNNKQVLRYVIGV